MKRVHVVAASPFVEMEEGKEQLAEHEEDGENEPVGVGQVNRR